HIEQGPGMWRRDERLAIVTAIAGRRQYTCEIYGQANHAGSTSMTDRHDALVGAAKIIEELEGLAKKLSPQTVITVGRLENHPNAVNVIPDRVSFAIDFRAPADDLLEKGDPEIEKLGAAICEKRGLQFKLEQTESIGAVAMDERLCHRLREIAGGNVPMTTSGALHDSAVIGPHLPTAMLFIPSRDGISHNPAEFSRIEDISAAAEVIEKAVSIGAI
ncbi:MAG TPA: M20/M25/M40 family metallo-hydrolase, partial [Tepidisphaeraceae bacterium]|nr:M20/M25/M40 family metallo-hydrolase [Tepidisphaeraceae bacterium]